MASVRKRKWTHKGVEKEAWIVAYTDQAGKRRMATFEKKKEADKHRTKVETEIEKGIHTPDSSTVTVKQLAHEYLQELERRVADGRIGYGYMLRYRSLMSHLVPILGAVKVKDLTIRHAEDFYGTMLKTIGAATAKSYMRQAKRVEAFAASRGYTRAAAFGSYLPELRGIPTNTIRTFDHKEVSHLLHVVDNRLPTFHHRLHLLLRCFVNVAAFCGLRFGEIAGLKLENIDLHKRVLQVRHGLTRHDQLKGPKTRSGVRDVPLPAHIVGILTEWKDSYYVPNGRGLFFLTVKGRGWNAILFNRPWRALLVRAGLDDGDETFHFHALRHFAASWMIENGLPLMDVAALLGHAKFDLTLQIYAHPVVGGTRRHDTMDRMASALIAIPARQESDMAV